MPSFYLVIGHITKDVYPGGYKLGGTATFSALTARNLGHQAGIVTCHGSDIDLNRLPADLQIVSRAFDSPSTTFENIYHDGRRRQVIRAHAGALTSSDVPMSLRNSAIVHLGPVAREVSDEIADCFPTSLLGLTPQGWMRRWDEHGVVHPAAWRPASALLRRADAIILSEEDVGGDVALVESLAAQTSVLVLTAGWQGAAVYHAGQRRSFASPQVNEVDPTGAGDIFAAAFMSALEQRRDPWLAARFANCVAAHSVERSGLDSIPTRQEIGRCRALFDL